MVDSPLGNLLVCSICLDQYNEPRILPCHHSFCKECLTRIPLEHSNENYTLRCPTCREQTRLPGEGAAAFPPSFLINSLLEVRQKKENVSDNCSNICEEHNKPCDIYCEDCGVIICHHCLVRQHQKHANSLITDCHGKNIMLITKLLSQMKSGVDNLERASTVLEKTEGKIIKQEKHVEEAVNSTADEKIHQINHCRQELLRKARSITERKLAMIQVQKTQATATLKKARVCEKSISFFLQEGMQQLLLEKKSQVISELESAIKMVDVKNFAPAEAIDLTFCKKFNDNMGIFGSVDASFINESFKGGNDLVIATCNKKSHFIVIHEPSQPNSLFRPSKEMFSYQLVQTKGIKMEDKECEVRYIEDLCVYQVYFTPVAVGPHHLVINVGGHPIMGSPFVVHAFSSLVPKQAISFKSPCGIAVKNDGTMVISENGQNRVYIFHPSGKNNTFPCQKPAGVAITPDDHIIVANETNKQIKKFNFDGHLLGELERSGSLKAAVPVPVPRSNTPYGITVSKDGRVYVTETSSGNCCELNSDLTIVKQRSGYNSPTGIAIDSKGNIFIASRSNNNVIKCNDKTGKTMTFGSKGSKEGQLRHPMAIAIDANDIVYVADTGNNRISIFDSNGQFLLCFGQKGNGPSNFNEPCGIAVSSKGQLYVCDTGNDRVVVYQ